VHSQRHRRTIPPTRIQVVYSSLIYPSTNTVFPTSVIDGGTHAGGLTDFQLTGREIHPPSANLSFFDPEYTKLDHARRHLSRTSLIHAPRIALPTLKPIPRSAPLPSIRKQSLRLGRLCISPRSALVIGTAALHTSERALARCGE
jgi:hypothetical protein